MPTPAAHPAPLCVDLNGSLTRTDLFFETFFVLVKESPLSIFLCFVWSLRGRTYLNEQIAQRVNIDTRLRRRSQSANAPRKL